MNLYKVKWVQKSHGMGDSVERLEFVLADEPGQITSAYPTLISLEWFGRIAKDLRAPAK